MKRISNFKIIQLIIFGGFALTSSCVNEVDQKLLPVLTTTEISILTEATAKSGGNITSNGGSDIIQRGVCWSTSSNPTIADSITKDSTGIGVFSSIITKILPCTTYYVRAYAINRKGTSYGNELSFTTTANLPTLTTVDINHITMSSAVIEGNIQDNGNAQITTCGFCWSINPHPTITDNHTQDGFSSNSFTSTINNLTIEKNYYVRAYATNSAGTAYGNEKKFTTTGLPMPINRANIITFNSNLNYGTVTDIDGNVYKTITIGKYTWIAENLRVSRFRNGDPIPYLNDNSDWECYDFFVPGKIGLCDYQNTHNIDSIAKYGFLYTLRTIMDSRNIAPIGWHIADAIEWNSIIYDNTLTVCGIDWDSSAKDVSNVNNSGLTILPSGYRDNTGDFFNKNNCFQVSVGGAWAIIFPTFKYVAGSGQIYNHANAIQWGYSVRCVKDY